MPNVDLTEMDLAVIECLHEMSLSGDTGIQPTTLVPWLQQKFPDNDQVAMREGESITRLRGHQLLEVHAEGWITLTSSGVEKAENLRLAHGES
jgi:hypothetical protein